MGSQVLRVLFCPTCDICPNGGHGFTSTASYKRFLDMNYISYQAVTEKEDPGAVDLVKRQNGGKIITPSFILADGRVLTQPSLEQLKSALDIANDKSINTYDLVVIGSGPAGMNAANTVARNGWQVLILEKRDSFGGQIDEFSRIAYYPGIPDGSSGRALMDHLERSRQGLGIAIKYQEEVDTIQPNQYAFEIKTTAGHTYRTSAILLATGASYHTPVIPKPAIRGAANVYFNATDLLANFQGDQVLLYGESRNVFQAAICPWSKPTRSGVVEWIVFPSNRNPKLSLSISHTLEAAGVTFRKDTTLIDYKGDRVVTEITIKPNAKGGVPEALQPDGIFIFPTLTVVDKWFPPEIKRDREGFITANNSMETTLSGVFIAGDVRAGSIKDIAGAVTDGTIVGEMIKMYLSSRR